MPFRSQFQVRKKSLLKNSHNYFRNFGPRKTPKKPVGRNDFNKTPLQQLNEYTQQRLLAAPVFEEIPTGPPFKVFCHVRELSLVTEVRSCYIKVTPQDLYSQKS